MRMIACAVACVTGLLALGLAQPEPAAAADDAPSLHGTLEATPYDVIPPDARFAVRPMSGSPAAKAMAQVLLKAISENGRPTGGSDAYVVRFELSSDLPRVDSSPGIKLRGEGGSANVGNDVGVVMQWKLRREGGAEAGQRRMLVTVNDPAGHVVWEGHVDLTVKNMDDVTIMSRIAPTLARSLGESIAGRTLP